MTYELQFAREQAAWVASDRVGHMSQEQKASLLNRVDLTLERWKLEQTLSDGTIAVEPPQREFGWFDSRGNEPSDQRERIPAVDLRPEQCAGPFVRSKSDLFTKLWIDEYGPIRQITCKPNARRDTVMALLMERDGHSMSAESLVSALHCIWTHVWASREAFRKRLTEKQAHDAEQLANARAISVAVRTGERRRRDQAIFAMAVDFYKNAPSLKVKDVAAQVYSRVKDCKGFENHTELGTRERIKGAKKEALLRLRAQP